MSLDRTLLQGKRIFMVEDNVDNIYVIMTLLRQYGATVIVDWWATGQSKRLLEALPLDLIILDLMLSGTRSGYDIFEEIHALPETSGIPIVAVSATDASTAIPRAYRKGFSGFIAKPIDFDLFPVQIAALIRGEPIWYAQNRVWPNPD